MVEGNQEIAKEVTMADPQINLPPVFFNHLYIVLDDKTYRAVQGSDFLRSAFPGKELRSTLTAAQESWAGTYYYCQDNYLEFFGESTGRHWRSAARVGWSGLAFSTDRIGGVDKVRNKIQKSFGYEPYYELRQLNTGEATTNWFHYVSLAEQVDLEAFDSWVMEYHPDIFKLKNLPRPSSGELTRRAYLSAWNQDDISKAGEHRRDVPVFSRVIGATIIMDRSQAEAYSRMMLLLGYSVKSETDQLVITGNHFTLKISIRPYVAAAPVFRVSCIKLEMIRPSVAPTTFVFAPGSRLVLNENLTADWYFQRSIP